MKKLSVSLIILFLLPIIFIAAQEKSDSISWNALKALTGTWKGAGSGAPGQGTGQAVFSFDLQNQVLLRRNHTDFPPANSKPALSHDDLMIIFREGNLIKASYFDNEGHKIDYTVMIKHNPLKITFESSPSASAPQFRLIYDFLSENKANNIFEIAMPGQPGQFRKYLEAVIIKE